MGIPGENLLDVAMTVLDSQEVNYFQFLSREANEMGVFVTTYSDPITVFEGMVQPVNRSVYRDRGLDWNKSFVSWFVPFINATDLIRDQSGDVFECQGRRYQLDGKTDWFFQDGWVEMLACDIGPATGATTNA